MIRRTEGEYPLFILDTDHTSYLFRVMPTGHLEHLYYGRKLHIRNAEEAEALVEKRSFEPGNAIRYYGSKDPVILEDLRLEASFGGHGDLREPFAEIVGADGSRSLDLLFSKAETSRGGLRLRDLPSSYDDDDQQDHLVVTLEDRHALVSLELHYCVYPECDVITRNAVIINSGRDVVSLERLLSLQLDLDNAGWVVSAFHGAWAREMERTEVAVSAGRFVIESRTGTSSNRANPFFMLHSSEATETTGDCFGFNLVYSGNHRETIEVNAYGKTRVTCGIHPDGFRYTLEPSERFEAPEAVMTYSPNGFGGQSANMHRFVRKHIVRGNWRDKIRPVLLNSWEACYFGISEQNLVSLARVGKSVGIELFVVDDGWFAEREDDTKSLGDWKPNTRKLPTGLKGLCREINELGMEFGVWVEPEMVNVDSDLYRAHPEWAMAIPGRPHSEGRNQRILDLANPEVVDYLTEKMTEVFSSANIAYVKWDMNRVFTDVFSPYLPADKQGETTHRYVCGLYRMMRVLTERFPDILFEGCSSGGNRFDLGILSYFPQIWGSDNTDAIERLQIQEGYSYGYPMNTVGAHVSAVPNHQTLRSAPLSTRFNVAAFGVLGYEYNLKDLPASSLREIRKQIALYKKWREVLQFGSFYRGRTGDVREWICVSPDRRKAVGLLLQKTAAANPGSESFHAQGLDEDVFYRFYNRPERVNVKLFGSLINTIAPIHIRPDSLLHNAVARRVALPGEEENILASGSVLMYGGVHLKQAFSASGHNSSVRVFPDFASRLYYMEAEPYEEK